MKTRQTKAQYKQISALHAVLCRELFTINAKLPYSTLTSLFKLLAQSVKQYADDSEQLWYIGETDAATLDSLIVGAYWHYSEWYSGQWSDEYATMCALGKVFSPGCTSAPKRGESEFDVYHALGKMARKASKMPVYDFQPLISK
ncbi:MAG: hypothetical protein ACK5XN_34910 [Bacteroidota bacterium]|jgi:hypothetical protein